MDVVDVLLLERGEEGLHRRVVETVAASAHRLLDAVPSQDLPVGLGGVLVPALHLLDDPVRLGGPDEGPRVGVGFIQVAVDGGLQLDQRGEAAPPEAALGQGREEALDGVEPGARGRGVAGGHLTVHEPLANQGTHVTGLRKGRRLVPAGRA
jgi:hypothetical protein